MRTVYNSSTSPVTVDGYVVNPGVGYIPGVGHAYVSPAGDVEFENPMYVESFSAGFLITVPLLSVLAIRWCMRLLKPSQLDRFS